MIEKHSHSRIEYMIKVRSSEIIMAGLSSLLIVFSASPAAPSYTTTSCFPGTFLFRKVDLYVYVLCCAASQQTVVEGNCLAAL